jgi:drug/metabolite transporter (DMT)-like permease
VVVQIAFASQAVEAKVAMSPRAGGGEGIAPEALAMTRMLGGALFFQGLLALQGLRRAGPTVRPGAGATGAAAPLSGADHLRLAGLSVLGIALNQTLFLLGLRWTTPFAVSLLSATIPVFAAALAIAFRKEPFAWRTALGIALALAGVVWLAGRGAVDLGAVLVALNSLSYAAYVVLSRETVLRLGAVRVVAWIFTYGALLFAPVGLGPMMAQLQELTPRGAWLVAFIVLVPTIVAYALNAWALGRSSATLVTVYIYLQPLFAAILARVQLGQTVSERAVVAALLILSGLGVVATRGATRGLSARVRRAR